MDLKNHHKDAFKIYLIIFFPNTLYDKISLKGDIIYTNYIQMRLQIISVLIYFNLYRK